MRSGWILFFAAALLSGADSPRIVYSKTFPGSMPAYVEISLDKKGSALYKEAADDASPLSFQLAPEDTAQVFALAAKLGNFTRPLESKLKVANTGMKKFRYEDGSVKNEVQFNYSTDPDARSLWDWFERITETERHLLHLERTARFDKLGINKALLELETSRDRNRLVSPEQFLPILDRISKNESFMHMSRARAAGLAEGFRKANQE